MLCPKCESENRPEARFCDQCGFPLTEPETLENADSPQDVTDETECGDELDDETIETDFELYQPVDSENTDSFDPAASIDRLVFDGVEPVDVQLTHAIDLSGIDTQSEEYGERLVSSDYIIPESSFRDGETVQMKRIEGEDIVKSKEYLSSSTTKKKHPWRTVALVVALIAAVCALIAFATYEAGLWGGKPIPDVVGMTEADARSTLEGSGFEVRVDQVRSDDTSGLVLLMDPSGGQRVEEGSEVVIHVAIARTIPEVVGKSQSEAEQLLADAGFTNVKTKKQSSEKKEGTVLASSPKPGTEARSSEEVILTLAQPYTVPDIANKSFDDAVKALKDAGLGYDVLYIDTESYPEGTIIGTDPAAGTVVKKGDYIMIQIAQDHGSVLEEAALETLAPGTTFEHGGSSYSIESCDSVTYIGNNTVSYTVTAREYVVVFGSTVSNPSAESVSGTIVFDDDNQIVTIS